MWVCRCRILFAHLSAWSTRIDLLCMRRCVILNLLCLLPARDYPPELLVLLSAFCCLPPPACFRPCLPCPHMLPTASHPSCPPCAQMNAMLRHKNMFVRGVALLYLRNVGEPQQLMNWFGIMFQ